MDRKIKIKRDSDQQGYQGYAKIESSGLTAEQKQEFRDILQRYDEDAVERFIDGIDICLREAAISLWKNGHKGDKTNIRKHKKAVLRALERAVYHCEFWWYETLSRGQRHAPQPEPHEFPLKYFHWDECMPLFEFYSNLIELRNRLKKELETTPDGRPPDQETKVIIVEHIAFFYRKYLGKPTYYRRREKASPFLKVVELSFAYLGLPAPDRLIRTAAKKN